MTDLDKFSRRNRPQREVYTPGNGLLPRRGQDGSIKSSERKFINHSVGNTDRSAEINKITEKLRKISTGTADEADEKNGDSSKKAKRPDYAIYVPKRVAEAQAYRGKEKDTLPVEPKPPDIPPNPLGHNDKRSQDKSKKKKKKPKNTNFDSVKPHDKSLLNSEVFKSRESLHSDDNRFVRQSSEPRHLPLTQQDNRLKDLRSIDTSRIHEKFASRAKPPLCRRGSFSKGNMKSFPPSFDNLPPRLQKKYIAESGIQDLPLFQSPITEAWDGSSVTFQGKPPVSREVVTENNGPKAFPDWCKTLPCAGRARGRARTNREAQEPARITRSLTPETVQSGQFDNVIEDHERNAHTVYSLRQNVKNNLWTSERCQKPSREEFMKPDSRSKGSTLKQDVEMGRHTDTSDAEDVLDWAAEVERCEQGDTDHQLSDSKGSFSQPLIKNKKKRRNRLKRRDSNGRSMSREDRLAYSGESGCRRGSVTEGGGGSRNASSERNWREQPPGGGGLQQGQQQRGRRGSRKNSACGQETGGSRQASSERWESFRRSRHNSSCDNRSRGSSGERRGEGGANGRRGGSRKSRRSRDRDHSKENRGVPGLVQETNWRLEQEILARERERHEKLMSGGTSGSKTAGILVLPGPLKDSSTSSISPRKNSASGTGQQGLGTGAGKSPPQLLHLQPPLPAAPPKRLYDPSNPDKFIMVPSSSRGEESSSAKGVSPLAGYLPDMPQLLSACPVEQLTAKPVWYNPYTENFQVSHNPQLIRAIEQADCELQYLLSTCELLKYWERMQLLRTFLKEALTCLLMTDLRFCEIENVEQHFWKILYYNVIELLRKLMTDHPDAKESYKLALLAVVQEGCEYFEKLLKDLECHHKIKLEDFLTTPICLRENLKYSVLPLISAQKIYLCLGDLARYREQANETSNYGLARQWYLKANQINPKNGRPYNQLAILALYTKRKLDAVYYYMRCLMSSNPISAARESLITLFDENRKKYEAVDRKRKEEKAKKEREKMKEKESGGGGGIRREIWVHPAGGRKNMHRTTSTCRADCDSEDEELYAASEIEVNKRFVTSYLHVHGKIFTKIGLESLTETGLLMLKQFRALLQHSPLPLNCNRFLQLLALNMFAIEVSQPKEGVVNPNDGCYRSATQESALVISLQMFNLILERFVRILQDHINSPAPNNSQPLLPPDCLEMLPALKVWGDWLMTHVEIWNPPPSIQDYKVGPPGDCWSRMATLINLLEKINFKSDILSADEHPDYEVVYLPEDATLSGFTPLMANINEPKYKHKDVDLEVAQTSLRLQKILFVGTVFLCGLDPPVLKLQKVPQTGDSEYISVVQTELTSGQVLIDEEEERWSESEDSGKDTGGEDEDPPGPPSPVELMAGLAARRRQLQLQAKSRLSQLARITNALTEMEIRPRDLVPDTNCFIESLSELETILKVLPNPQHPYVLMVPLVVVNELEGLSKGCKPSQSTHHSALVRETAKAAMALFGKRHPALRTCTTRGTVLSSTVFTLEEDLGTEMTNDDKILTTCMNLCKTFHKDEVKEGGKRKLYRDVVLLTEDRNLSLKAMARDMPVRSLADFIQWAGLG